MKKFFKNLLLFFIALIIGSQIAMAIQNSIVADIIPAKDITEYDNIKTDEVELEIKAYNKSSAEISEEKNDEEEKKERKEKSEKEKPKELIEEQKENEPIDEDETEKKQVFTRRKISYLDLNNKAFYYGMHRGDVLDGLGILFLDNGFDEIIAYGEFENNDINYKKSKAFVKIPDVIEPIKNDISFILPDESFANKKHLEKMGATFVKFVEKDGLLNLFDDPVLKISLEPTDFFYLGDFKDNLVHGKGILYHSVSRDLYFKSYKGSFNKGYSDGEGTYYNWFNRIEYSGEIKDGYRYGYGVYYYSDGTIKYEGEWKDNKFDDEGVLYHQNGNIKYIGEWNDGEKDGKGKLYSSSGRLIYEGKFKNDEYHGKGKLYDEKGDLHYEGEFKEGDPK